MKNRSGRSPIRGGASLESMAAVLSSDRTARSTTRRDTLSTVASLIARSTDADSGVIAALALVKRVTGARSARIEVGATPESRRTMWSDGTSGAAGDERATAVRSYPLVSAGEVAGSLILDSPGQPAAEVDELAAAAADLFAITISRDARMRQLEQQVQVRIRELAEQRLFMEKIVDSLPFGLHVVDRDYRIQAWNHKRETGMLGVSRTDAIGRTIFDVFSRQPRELIQKEFDDVFATGELQQFQTESSATGDVRTFRVSKIPMSLASDDVSHVITVGEDITEWKAALDRIAHTEKLAALGKLAAGVMHELNNPLATIAACAESLAVAPGSGTQAGTSDDTAPWLNIIDAEVQRCRRIIDGLLDFSRSKASERTVVELNDVLRRVLFLLQHHPSFKRVITETDITEVPLMVMGDADQLIQALITVAMNACDATPPGKKVTFRSREIEDDVGHRLAVMEISDEGPGVSPALESRIFEPFFTTKEQGKGTGLGLSICYGIITQHGGTFELVEAGVPGATFRITLPVATADGDEVR